MIMNPFVKNGLTKHALGTPIHTRDVHCKNHIEESLTASKGRQNLTSGFEIIYAVLQFVLDGMKMFQL